MPIKLTNNAVATLATGITASDTGAVLSTGDGAKFPTLGSDDYFYATVESTGGTIEIVKVTARSGDSLTIARAQEGTTANSFAAGALVELRVTAQSVVDVATQLTIAEAVTAANIAAVGNAINTANKVQGKVVYDTTNNRLMVASGSAAAAAWYVADGSASVVPA